MRVRIMLQITGDDGIPGAVEEVAAFDKETERPEQVGLSLAEGQSLLAAVQHDIVQAQVESWTDRRRCCLPAVSAVAARAVIPSYSGRSMETFRWPAPGCTVVRASPIPRPSQYRPCESFSRIMSRPRDCTWRRGGRRSYLMPPQPNCSPMSCRSRRVPMP